MSRCLKRLSSDPKGGLSSVKTENRDQSSNESDVRSDYESAQEEMTEGVVEEELVYKETPGEVFRSFLTAIGLAILLRIFIFEAYTIPSGSMIPTLAVGDYIFINKLAYGLWNPFSGRQGLNWGGPSRGDVIVFDYPCDEKDYIKRVVAVAGDDVEVSPEGYFTSNGSWVKRRAKVSLPSICASSQA